MEEVFNLALALANVAVSLLDPVLQFANGVDLYMESARSAPIIVSSLNTLLYKSLKIQMYHYHTL